MAKDGGTTQSVRIRRKSMRACDNTLIHRQFNSTTLESDRGGWYRKWYHH